MGEEDNLTPAEQEQFAELMNTYGSPKAEEKNNAHVFLSTVAKSEDTTKTGNLSNEEIGFTRFSIRSYKELSLIGSTIMENDFIKDYWAKRGEILTATSLSRNGFLTGLAVVQRKQIEDMNLSSMKENKGWFKKKEVTG